MTDLDREVRALLEEDARDAPPIPETAPTLRRTRRRQLSVVLAGTAAAVVLVLASVTGVSAMVRSLDRRMPLGRERTPSPIASEMCPLGSTPDDAGPVHQVRPPEGWYPISIAFDRGSHRLLLLPRDGGMWAFDVCANTWEVASELGPSEGGDLVYDIDSDRVMTVASTRAGLQVWAFDAGGRAWTGMSELVPSDTDRSIGFDFGAGTQSVYDPVTGLVVIRVPTEPSWMWTYDIETDTWTEVEQGDLVPPDARVEGGVLTHELLTFDASADRLVLYVEDAHTGPSAQQTWEFDLRAGRWEFQDIDTPHVGLGWVETGEEMVYEEASEVSFVYGFLRTAFAYDASDNRWLDLWLELSQPGTAEGPIPDGEVISYDPLNERIVFVGGAKHARDAVWAFDLATGQWTTLLAPTD